MTELKGPESPSFESPERTAEAIIKERKIPSQSEKEKVSNYLKNLLGEDVEEEKRKDNWGLAREYLDLYESQFVDDRYIFQEEKLVNKNFVKETIKDRLNEGNHNLVRASLDVEGLKTINDIMGHEKGDQYLYLIYQKIKEAVEEIKKLNPEIAKEAEFIISGEGGDEFGVLAAGPKDGSIDLSKANFKLGSEKTKGGSLEEVLGQQINDKLAEIDFKKEGVVEEKDIIARLKKYYQEYFKDYLNTIESDLTPREIERKLRRYEKTVLEDPEISSWEDLSEEQKRKKLLEIIQNQENQKMTELEERFKDYEFFASASCGVTSFSKIYQNEPDSIAEKASELKGKNTGLATSEAENLAGMDLFFQGADEKMNQDKALFKYQARQARHLGEHDPESEDYWIKKEGINLANHIMVLSRSSEQMELLMELEEIYEENAYLEKRRRELKKERENLKEDLKKCQSKLSGEE